MAIEVAMQRLAGMFREGWLIINGVPSHVLTWGGWVDGPLTEGDRIILFMCGVPGITLFYQSFLERLYENMSIPIWTICIAGQEIPPSSTNLALPDETGLYDNVAAQVAHKLTFVRDYVPKERNILFIGHSFGSKMVIELLKYEQVSSRVEKSILLMPTLERFGDTPRAKFWLRMVNTGCIYSIVLCTWILSLLPVSWRKQFSSWYFQSRCLYKVDDWCHDAMVHLCDPTVFYNVRTLVWDELESIKTLDTKVLASFKDRMKVYFAPEDYWAPLTHYETLKEAVPELPVEILDSRFIHAFTLDTSQEMADIITADLKPYLS